jgi:hypothetical protein
LVRRCFGEVRGIGRASLLSDVSWTLEYMLPFPITYTQIRKEMDGELWLLLVQW